MTVEWGDAPTWAAFVVSAGAGGVAWRALKHAKASASASEISAQAAVRQAAAAERQVELAEAAFEAAKEQAAESHLPVDTSATREALTSPNPDYAAWWLVQTSKNRYVLRNIGTKTARNVEIDQSRIKCVLRGDTRADEVPPQASIELLLIPMFGAPKPNEIWVRWDDHPEWAALPLPA
ncbi:hypothetical protein [Micromonospora sp. NPDC050200]|uniref:hypothetical protein n=1 Tax=Micromonospora sp. NPDC050200 TaxID=3155664 RepID=UPI0033F32413